MKLLTHIVVASGLILSATAMATIHPMKLSSDSRIEVVAFSPYNVVPVTGTTFTTTQITFAKNEFIENVQNGDLGAWTASISKNIPNMMFVKPTVYGSNTNMTVVTNMHTYYFHLTSNKRGEQNQSKATYAIHFVYPEAQKKKVEAEIARREKQKQAEISAFSNPSSYNWNYSFNGDKSIMPLHVFDDGTFTYMQMRPNQPEPAVFAVTSASGAESVVNYRQDGQYIVIQRTAPQFTLRLGKDHVASIFNNTTIKHYREHGYG